MTSQDQCREAFEAWVMRNPRPGTHLDRSHNGDYKDNRVKAKWAAWQAAHSAAAAGMPAGWVAVPVEPTEAMLNAVHESAYVTRALAWREAETARYAALLAAAPKLPQGDGWRPIEDAPKDQLVMVYSPPQKDDDPEVVRIEFDHIDAGIADGYWYAHGESYEHFCCVAKPEGCTGPSEKAPYTHWHPIPQPPKEQT